MNNFKERVYSDTFQKVVEEDNYKELEDFRGALISVVRSELEFLHDDIISEETCVGKYSSLDMYKELAEVLMDIEDMSIERFGGLTGDEYGYLQMLSEEALSWFKFTKVVSDVQAAARATIKAEEYPISFDEMLEELSSTMRR